MPEKLIPKPTKKSEVNLAYIRQQEENRKHGLSNEQFQQWCEALDEIEKNPELSGNKQKKRNAIINKYIALFLPELNGKKTLTLAEQAKMRRYGHL